MKVACIIDSISRNAGGVSQALMALTKALSGAGGAEMSVHGIADDQANADAASWAPVPVVVHPPFGPRGLGFSASLGRALLDDEIDLLHVHAIWQGQSFAVHRAHRATKTPYLISPHGMLDPWALGQSRWKKRLASICYEAVHLRDAACIHALCESEASAIRAYGLKNPIVLIPNGVTLPETKNEEPGTKNEEPKTLLFLGRLHPKKGLTNALKAWREVMGHGSRGTGRDEWQFVIAGWDQGGHEAELQTLCRELGLSFTTKNQDPRTKNGELVAFVGPAFGDAKDELLRSADAFILPSFSEGLPMAVLEAWAYGLPMAMTDHCNLPEGFAAGAAVKIGTDETTIAEGMRILFEMSDDERSTMGAAGRELVEERFTWPKVAAQMKEVYEWILGGRERPGCLY